MSISLETLNPPQRKAVETIHGPVLVLAGAGTGKTRVITYRMAHMIDRGISPRHILAVTFTNKAAKEMKERYLKLVDTRKNPAARELIAGTFHSFCVRVLRHNIQHLGYKKNFTIYDASDQLSLLKKIITKLCGNTESTDPSKISSLISLAKNKGIDVEQLSEDNLAQMIFQRYQQQLKLHNAVDFDDLLVLTVRLLKEFPDIRAHLRDQHRYLMIDEFQDTNGLQFDLVHLLSSNSRDLCVVGDDDQSIYSWRGAESTHILEFNSKFPGATVVKLEQNYRCTPNILKAANSVIKNNARRHEKSLWAEGAPGHAIRLITAKNDIDEASWIVSDILKDRRERNYQWEDFAILYRTNQLSRILEQELRKVQIPYRVLGGLSFYERREIKDLLSYLQAIRNPDDDISLLRIMNTPPRGIGNSTIEKLIENSRIHDRSVWEEIQSDISSYRPQAREAIEDFIRLLVHYRDAFYMESCKSHVLEELIEEINYYDDLSRTCKNNQEIQSRVENIKDLISSLHSFEEYNKGGLDAFLDTTVLDQKNEEKDEDSKGTGVTLMTLHSAKGLEFPIVYLVGLEDGILPHDRSKIENNLDEERRLFYVGVTRAQKKLTLSMCSSRRKYGEDLPCHPSPFLTELPTDIVEPIDATIESEADIQHDHAVSQLSSLRSRLSTS